MVLTWSPPRPAPHTLGYIRFGRRLGLKSIKHSPLSAAIHAALTLLGFYYHRGMLSTSGKRGRVPPLAVGPGPIGLVEPYVSNTESAVLCHTAGVRATDMISIRESYALLPALYLSMFWII